VKAYLRAYGKAGTASSAKGLIDGHSSSFFVLFDGSLGASGKALGLAALRAYCRIALSQCFVLYDPHPG
jgi:hypothetical protein